MEEMEQKKSAHLWDLQSNFIDSKKPMVKVKPEDGVSRGCYEQKKTVSTLKKRKSLGMETDFCLWGSSGEASELSGRNLGARHLYATQ